MKLSKEEALFVERLRKLREEADPEEARRFTESLPVIDDSAGTLAISFAHLRGIKPKKAPETAEDEIDERDDKD